jgi:lysophospholipase L1-like esterase
MTLDALTRMAGQLRGAGIRPVLFYHPTTTERSGAPRAEAGVFRDWAAGAGAGFVDLGLSDIDPSGYRDRIHPNAAGAARLAAVLRSHLAQDLAPCT